MADMQLPVCVSTQRMMEPRLESVVTYHSFAILSPELLILLQET